jgi:hypothetical protein
MIVRKWVHAEEGGLELGHPVSPGSYPEASWPPESHSDSWTEIGKWQWVCSHLCYKEDEIEELIGVKVL